MDQYRDVKLGVCWLESREGTILLSKQLMKWIFSQIGTPTASVSNEVAAVQRLMRASGLSYSMHSAGTTVGM
jgi:hypothetical protein